jgi:hypothetical protein
VERTTATTRREYGTWFVRTLGGATRYATGWLSVDGELGLVSVFERVSEDDGAGAWQTLLAVNLGALELVERFEGDLEDALDD